MLLFVVRVQTATFYIDPSLSEYGWLPPSIFSYGVYLVTKDVSYTTQICNNPNQAIFTDTFN